MSEKVSSSIVQRTDSNSDNKSIEASPEWTLLTGVERQKAEKRLIRKLDIRLLAPLVTLYTMNYIDRTSITSARLKGLEGDLNLTGIQYSAALAVFFAAYCPTQIPSNMFLNYISRPSWFISACVILWGLISTLTGVTKGFPGLVVCRLFLGFPEAAFFPGSVYFLSRWYTRKELALRTSFIYGGLTVSVAFGSLMAAGILSGMEGRLGIRAWRWLFYIEGAITIFLGIQLLWILPDYPHNARWLSPAERHLAQVRLAEDAGEADEDTRNDSPWTGLLAAVREPKTWLFASIAFFDLLGMGFVNFFPTLTATLGFSTTITLLLAAPPWILAAIICVANGRHADWSGERFFHVTFFWWMTILGYIVALSTMSVVGRYISLFFLASGHTGYALIFVWVSNSTPRPPAKRTATIGIVGGFGNLGNLVSTFIWRNEWSPKYEPSMIISLCALVIAISLAFVVRVILVRENKRFEREEVQQIMNEAGSRDRVKEAARLEGLTLEEALQRRHNFRYLY